MRGAASWSNIRQITQCSHHARGAASLLGITVMIATCKDLQIHCAHLAKTKKVYPGAVHVTIDSKQ